MPEAKVLKRGDPCPSCGSELQPAAVPTDDEYRRYTDRENPQSFPTGADTASPTQRKELGALYRCVNGKCGYTTRFREDADREREPAATEHDRSATREAQAASRARPAAKDATP